MLEHEIRNILRIALDIRPYRFRSGYYRLMLKSGFVFTLCEISQCPRRVGFVVQQRQYIRVRGQLHIKKRILRRVR